MTNDSRTLDEILASEARAIAEVKRLNDLINNPGRSEWVADVMIEAAHQNERWPATQDARKTPEDWFWLVGYLAGKCLASFKAGDADKARHHTISTAAVCYQWSKSIKERADTRAKLYPDAKVVSEDEQEFTDGDGTMEVENPPTPTDRRCEGGGVATNGDCIECNAAMGETCRIKDTIR